MGFTLEYQSYWWIVWDAIVYHNDNGPFFIVQWTINRGWIKYFFFIDTLQCTVYNYPSENTYHDNVWNTNLSFMVKILHLEIILNIVKVTVALKQCYVDNLIRRPEVIQYKTTRFKMRQDYSGMKLRFCASIFSGWQSNG